MPHSFENCANTRKIDFVDGRISYLIEGKHPEWEYSSTNEMNLPGEVWTTTGWKAWSDQLTGDLHIFGINIVSMSRANQSSIKLIIITFVALYRLCHWRIVGVWLLYLTSSLKNHVCHCSLSVSVSPSHNFLLVFMKPRCLNPFDCPTASQIKVSAILVFVSSPTPRGWLRGVNTKPSTPRGSGFKARVSRFPVGVGTRGQNFISIHKVVSRCRFMSELLC